MTSNEKAGHCEVHSMSVRVRMQFYKFDINTEQVMVTSNGIYEITRVFTTRSITPILKYTYNINVDYAKVYVSL